MHLLGMSRPRFWRAVLAALALAPGAFAATADAKPIKATGFDARMVLRASHGYRIAIDGSDRLVDLRAFSGSDAEAEYRVRGRVTAHRLKANSLLCRGKIETGPFESCANDANSLFFLALLTEP
ncbi:MAG TPA: hypothetical protein VGI17_16300 [Solirubrobacterales bacterium]|jgi:hypothetical protein